MVHPMNIQHGYLFQPIYLALLIPYINTYSHSLFLCLLGTGGFDICVQFDCGHRRTNITINIRQVRMVAQFDHCHCLGLHWLDDGDICD